LRRRRRGSSLGRQTQAATWRYFKEHLGTQLQQIVWMVLHSPVAAGGSDDVLHEIAEIADQRHSTLQHVENRVSWPGAMHHQVLRANRQVHVAARRPSRL
jgi:hypothetical protein